MSRATHGVLQKDDNGYPVMGGVSSSDITLVVNCEIDPITGRLLVDLVGSSGSGFQQPLSGVVNGTNKVFTWATAPNAIVVDQTKTMQAINSAPDSNVNWTGTTTTTLQVAPTFDIYAIA